MIYIVLCASIVWWAYTPQWVLGHWLWLPILILPEYYKICAKDHLGLILWEFLLSLGLSCRMRIGGCHTPWGVNNFRRVCRGVKTNKKTAAEHIKCRRLDWHVYYVSNIGFYHHLLVTLSVERGLVQVKISNYSDTQAFYLFQTEYFWDGGESW